MPPSRKSFLQFANDLMTKAEFKAAFQRVLNVIKIGEANLTARIDKRLAEIKDGVDGKDGPQGPRGEKGDTVVGPPGPPGPQGKKGDTIVGPKGDNADVREAVQQVLPLVIAEVDKRVPLLGDALRSTLEGDLKKVLLDHTNKMLGSLGPGGGTSFSLMQSGVQKVQQPLALDFKGTGAPTITLGQNGVTHLDFSSSGGAVTLYSETPTGLINGSNKAYTTAHTITTVISLALNGGFIHPSDYVVSGSGFTMNTALDASLAGTGFTIVYA